MLTIRSALYLHMYADMRSRGDGLTGSYARLCSTIGSLPSLRQQIELKYPFSDTKCTILCPWCAHRSSSNSKNMTNVYALVCGKATPNVSNHRRIFPCGHHSIDALGDFTLWWRNATVFVRTHHSNPDSPSPTPELESLSQNSQLRHRHLTCQNSMENASFVL